MTTAAMRLCAGQCALLYLAEGDFLVAVASGIHQWEYDTWRKRGSDLGLGIGIAAGYATLGRIGFEGRYDYGAVGPVTNLAFRLSTHA